jgi:hypothetical protein
MRETTLLLFLAALAGCTPQSSAQFMPMIGMGNSLASQAMNLYMQQERLEQQQQMPNQQRPQYIP